MRYYVLILSVVFWASAAWAGNNSGAAFTVWPDTGQNKCFDYAGEIPCPAQPGTWYGQDAQYQGSARSYTKLDAHGNDLPFFASNWTTVRDNVTGLIWEVREEADGVFDWDNLRDADNIYTWCDTNADTNGGYEGNCNAELPNTQDVIEAMNEAGFGGYTDWRLPTHKELRSLYDYFVAYFHINTAFFPNTANTSHESIWTATTHAGDNEKAWRVGFPGAVGGFSAGGSFGSKSGIGFVRAVRGGYGAGGTLVNNNDGTVTDTATGLMWTRGTSPRMWWREALAWCEHLTLAGYTDWRLPSINELLSIVDHSRFDPAINPVFQTIVDGVGDYDHMPEPPFQYWSSTTLESSEPGWSQAYTGLFTSGGVGTYVKSLHLLMPEEYSDFPGFWVRAVRGGNVSVSNRRQSPWPMFLPAVTAGRP